MLTLVMVQVMVPDIPYSLDIKIKRERYLAKQALQVWCIPCIGRERKKLIIFQDVDHKKDDDEASPGFSKDYN